MKSYPEAVRAAVLADLGALGSSRKVAAKHGIHYQTVLIWKRQAEEQVAPRRWRCCNRLYVNTPACAVCGRAEPLTDPF